MGFLGEEREGWREEDVQTAAVRTMSRAQWFLISLPIMAVFYPQNLRSMLSFPTRTRTRKNVHKSFFSNRRRIKGRMKVRYIRTGGRNEGEGEEEVDVKECYRRRRVHSAGDEGPPHEDKQAGCSLYLSSPGPRPLGNRTGSALECVSDLGILLELGW